MAVSTGVRDHPPPSPSRVTAQLRRAPVPGAHGFRLRPLRGFAGQAPRQDGEGVEPGRVLVDGADLTMVDTAWLRRQIGVVLQENILFNQTIRENIALPDPALPMDRDRGSDARRRA